MTDKSLQQQDLRVLLSHDLRAPLACIKSALELLTSGIVPFDSEEARELVDISRHSSSQLIARIDNLLHDDSPAVEPPSPQTPTEPLQLPAATDAWARTHVRLLVVEDDTEFYRFIYLLLKRSQHCFFTIMRAGTIAECREYLSWERPDAILLDLGLPDSSGLGSLETIRRESPNVPLVVLTGTRDDLTARRAVSLGADDYVTKNHLEKGILEKSLCYAIERKKVEETRLKHTSIRDFSNTLAHDMKVPLIGVHNVLSGFLQGHLGELTAEQGKALCELNDANDRQLGLIDKMLDVYKYDIADGGMRSERLNLKSLLSECLLRVFGASAEGVNFTVPEDEIMVLGDRDAIDRLCCNLLENAMRFSDGQEPTAVTLETVAGKIALSIYNSGAPIPDAVKEGMHTHFWQGIPGKSYVAATGVGLYTCHRIASLHDGTMSCTVGETGNTITVRLPRCQTTQPVVAPSIR
jgi:signal transduction histidine kinase